MTIQLTVPSEQKHFFPNADIDGFGDIEEIAKELRAQFAEGELIAWDEFATDADVFADFMDFVAEWAIEHRAEILDEYVKTWEGHREYGAKKRDLIRAGKSAQKRYDDFKKLGIIKAGAQ